MRLVGGGGCAKGGVRLGVLWYSNGLVGGVMGVDGIAMMVVKVVMIE